MNTGPTQAPLPGWVFVLLGLLALFWGLSWPALKVVLTEMPPLHFRAWCLGVGAAGMFAIAALNRDALRVPRGSWPALIVIALCNIGAWNVLVAYGVPLMQSGRAAVVGYTFPVWGVLCGVLIAREPLTAQKALAMALGLGAVFFLLGGELEVVGRSPVGTLLLLGAAIGWALGTGFMKRWPVALPVSSFTAWQLAIAFVPVLIAALAFEPSALSPLELSGRALAGFAYLVLVCFMFCYWAWMKVTSVAPVSVSSINTLLVPVIGVFSGMVLLGERPHWTDYAALAFVIAALATQMLPGGSARIGTVRGAGERSAGARER